MSEIGENLVLPPGIGKDGGWPKARQGLTTGLYNFPRKVKKLKGNVLNHIIIEDNNKVRERMINPDGKLYQVKIEKTSQIIYITQD